jgi:putative membrane protein
MNLTMGLTNLISYAKYFGTDLALLIVAGFIYVKFTPANEVAEIRKGNAAAAVALAGAMLGFAMVLYSATTHSYGVVDTALWAMMALVVQIVAMEIITHVFHDDWKGEIESGDLGHGIILGAFSLAVGILNAACLT